MKQIIIALMIALVLATAWAQTEELPGYIGSLDVEGSQPSTFETYDEWHFATERAINVRCNHTLMKLMGSVVFDVEFEQHVWSKILGLEGGNVVIVMIRRHNTYEAIFYKRPGVDVAVNYVTEFTPIHERVYERRNAE
jgi:hypothetical protein